MAKKRQKMTPQFKDQVALEPVRKRESGRAIATRRALHPNQVGTWKRQLIYATPEAFASRQSGRQVHQGVRRVAP